MAEALGHAGRGEEALPMVKDALASVERTGERYYEAELHRLRAELLPTLQGDEGRAEAEACFHRALEVARRQEAKSLELRAATSLARVWLQQGRTADARAMLAPIVGWFTEGFDQPDLRDARVLISPPASAPSERPR